MTKAFYTNVQRRGNNIFLRYIEENGDRKSIKVPYKPSLYIKSNGSEVAAKGLLEEPLSKIVFDDIKSSSEFMKKYRGIDGFKVYGQKNPVFQFISDYFGKEDLTYNPEFVRIGIYDIEVYSGSFDEEGQPREGPFPYPEQAAFPLNMVTMWDSFDQKYYIFGMEYFDGHYLGTFDESKLDPDVREKIKGLDYEYKGFQTEAELLRAFVTLWNQNEYDIISGFNNVGFDDPYLYNRITAVLGSSWANKLSPWGIVNVREVKNKFNKDVLKIDYMGIAVLDYKEILEKHGYMEPDNWKLNTVADMIIGEGKIDYSEAKSLNTLYVTNYNKYAAYNMIDVALIVKMEIKKNLFPFLMFLTYMLRCLYEDTLKTTNMWLAYTYNKLHYMGYEPEIKGVKESRDFTGGYVREPIMGFHKYVVTIDANSLNV